MTIRRASVLLPCHNLDDFPTHLAGAEAAGLLAACTSLWHPALLAACGRLPGWRSTEDLTDPDELDGELVIVPWVSRQRLPGDWCDRLRATDPRNPFPVEGNTSRAQTVAAVLESAGAESNSVATSLASDFFALGYAYLQVELLARSMRYSSILQAGQFEDAAVEAARAAVAGDFTATQEGLTRAFDLLCDARNHSYSVDIYFVEIALLADSTLGESLRAKLTTGLPINLLATGALLEKIAAEHPETLTELRRALDAGTACVIGGQMHGDSPTPYAPEALLAELTRGQEAAQRVLSRNFEIFGQYSSTFPTLLPEILTNFGFRGVLHAGFDGSPIQKAEQCKTYWAPPQGPRIEALSAMPLDTAEPKTWLNLGARMGDSIMHDHVATVLLAGWPGQGSEFAEDMSRVAARSAVLGRFITLDEYFKTTREPDEWTTFWPQTRKHHFSVDTSPAAITKFAAEIRREVEATYDGLCDGLVKLVEANGAKYVEQFGTSVAINPWNFESAKFVDADPLDFFSVSAAPQATQPIYLSDLPGCGFGVLHSLPAIHQELASGRTLHNELMEVVVSEKTGGIQSLRARRDRSTRASQRLVFFDAHQSPTHSGSPSGEEETPRIETQMIAEGVDITRNDAVWGEITSHGRLLDAAGELLTHFTQMVRLPRGGSSVIVEVCLQPKRPPVGTVWSQYFATRLAWVDETVTLRAGSQWFGRDANGEHIFSPEWIEISDGLRPITCFGLGLPLHRRAGPTWLDTLLVGEGPEQRFQFALGLDTKYPTQAALAVLTAGRPSTTKLQSRPTADRGWFLHVGAKNVIVSYIEPLAGERAGVRLRLLETEGRSVRTNIVAFRPIRVARRTDFHGQQTELLSVVEGEIHLEIGSHRWLQIEAEW